MRRPLRIYIAGPYTALDQNGHQANTDRAIDAGIAVYRKGHYPYIPHLTHYVDRRAKETSIDLTWEDYIRWDMPWLRICDALLYLGKSKGADLELAKARRLKKRIFFSTDEVPNVVPQARTIGPTSSKRTRARPSDTRG